MIACNRYVKKSRKEGEIVEMGGKESCFFGQSTNQEAEVTREDGTIQFKIRTDDELVESDQHQKLVRCQGIGQRKIVF